MNLLKKNMAKIIILIVFSFNACSYAWALDQITISAGPELPWKSPLFYGFNTIFHLSPETLDNPQLAKAVAELNPTVLRFPGGVAQEYDWETGIWTVKKEKKKKKMAKKGLPRKVAFNEFLSFSNKFNSSIMYTLNITDSPEKISKLAKLWKEKKAPVKWVEMGNEYYLRNVRDAIGGPEGYISVSKQALAALRLGGYQGPTGISIAPEWVHGRHAKGFLAEWNEGLSKLDLSLFDAVILHYYPRMIENEYFPDLMDVASSGLSDAVSAINKKFPGKRVWVTEWNFRQTKSPEFNTLIHAIFVIKLLRDFMAADVDTTCYQVLAAGPFGLLGPDRKAYKYELTTKLLRRVPHFAFVMFRMAQKGNFFFFGDTENFEYMGFRGDKTAHVLLWSLSAKSVSVHLEVPDFDSTFVGGLRLVNDLMADNGHMPRWKELKGSTWKEKVMPVELQKSVFSGPGITLLEYNLQPATAKIPPAPPRDFREARR